MKLIKYLTFTLSSIVLIINSNPTHEDEDRLKTKLLSDYKSDIRPVSNLLNTVYIDAHLYLHTLYDLDFANNLLKARFVFIPYWIDEYLAWDPSEYNNIEHIYLRKHLVWTPSLIMCNSMNEHADSDMNRDVKVYSNGLIESWSLTYTETYCQVNAYTYPFDEHKCEIHICVALYSPNETRIKTVNYANINFTENFKWDIDFSGKVGGINDYCSHASVVIQLRRKLTLGMIAMLIPTVMMTILTLFVFVLPPESGEKVSLATTIFLSNVLYLVQIDQNIPKNSKHPSLLIIYLTLLSMISGIATLGSVVISKLYANQSFQENKNKTQSNKVADVSIISTVNSEASNEREHERKKKRKCFTDHVRMDAIFLNITIVLLVIISLLFVALVVNPQE